MALRLIIEDEEGATTIVPLGEEEVTIGREPGNTIQLTEQNVSRQHARLHQGTDGWVIEDLESYNGVKVNGVQVEGSVTLNEGDVVQIGDYHLALSNNVEQTTLNIERPGQAANEPNRAMPSVDLPRIPAGEAAAIATPTFTPSHGDRGHDRDEGREGGGGRGLMLVLGLIGVFHAGVEYGWWHGLTACSTADMSGSAQDVLNTIMNTPLVRCDTAQWTLAGISLEVGIEAGAAKARGRFIEDLLFTHRGLSGPAVLQASNYWQPGTPLRIDLAQGHDLSEALLQAASAVVMAVEASQRRRLRLGCFICRAGIFNERICSSQR